MPYKPSQVRAIAARMRREGKSPEEIRRFFHEHGVGGRGNAMTDAHRKSKKGKH